MIPRRKYIIARIPPPDGSDIKIVDIQTADDILACVYDSSKDSEWYTGAYAMLFADGNKNEDGTYDFNGICEDIWDFMQDQWPYDPNMAETEHRQEGRSVRAIIYDIMPRKFDCKHYATFAYSTLKALRIPCQLRLTSYNPIPEMSHIYVAAFNSKEDMEQSDRERAATGSSTVPVYIIDGTMPNYNEESKNGVTQRYLVKIEK